MHFAPETRWVTHSSRGRRPFDASPNSLTPSAHWTGSPTTFFFSRIADRQAVDRRVLGETELLGNLGHARVRVEVQKAKDRDRVPVQDLRGLLLFRPRLELEPLVDALALFGR